MAHSTFRSQRDQFVEIDAHRVVQNSDGWAVFVGYTMRGHPVQVQRATDEKRIMVRMGCRYKSLRAAMNYWGQRAKGMRGRQNLQLIELGLRIAERRGLIKSRHYPKWFSTKLRR